MVFDTRGQTRSLEQYQYQFHSSNDTIFYPATLKHTRFFGNNTPGNRLTINIPFKPLTQGIHHFPELRLQYFDTENGVIRETTVATAGLVVLHMPVLLTCVAVLSGFTLWLIRLLFNLAKEYWKIFYRYKEILLQAQQAKTVNDIRYILELIALTEKWKVNLTLRQWHNIFQQAFSQSLKGMDILEAASYSKHDTDIHVIKNSIIEFCLTRWKFLRWVTSPEKITHQQITGSRQ